MTLTFRWLACVSGIRSLPMRLVDMRQSRTGDGACPQVGLHDHPDWMPADDDIRLIHIHQDQVETLPPGAQ